MLIEFRFKNFLSFDEEQIFSMEASREKEHAHSVRTVGRGKSATKVVSISAIYGNNGSGKSNFVAALQFFIEKIDRPADNKERFRAPRFALTDDPSATTEFEVIFDLDGDQTAYGFVVGTESIEREWLSISDRIIFEREPTGVKLGPGFKPHGDLDKKFVEILLAFDTLGPYQLALSRGAAFNIPQFAKAREWFDGVIVATPDTEAFVHELVDREPAVRTVTLQILNQADVGIVDLKVARRPLPDSLVSSMPNSLRESLSKDGVMQLPTQHEWLIQSQGKFETVRLQFDHRGKEDGVFELEAGMESAGTLRLVAIAPTLAAIEQKQAHLVIIDELDLRLHPHVAQRLVQDIRSIVTQNPGQVIFTTHQPLLMNRELLRKDEIWLVDKDREGRSELVALDEYDIRSDLSWDRAFLAGRVGGVPRRPVSVG